MAATDASSSGRSGPSGHLPATMPAIRVAAPGPAGAMVLHPAVPLPLPTEPGSLLVRNEAIGVNFIDTYHRSGLYPVPTPFTPGVEGAGVVAAVGPGVAGFAPGDRVAYITRPPAGAYGAYTLAREDKTVHVPEGMDMETAAASMIQGMTALALVTRAAPVGPGDWVLVPAAAGGTGRLVAQAAAAAGATVIGTVSSAAKAAVAREAGCAHVLNYTEEDVPAAVSRLTGGRGCAAVYDGVGAATFEASLACCAPLGYMVSFGNASGKVPDVDIFKLTRNSVRLMRPALWEFIQTKEEFSALAARTLAAVAAGTLRLHVGGRWPLAEAAAAHVALEGRATTGKVLLVPPPA